MGRCAYVLLGAKLRISPHSAKHCGAKAASVQKILVPLHLIMNQYLTHTLPNGMRIILLWSPSQVVYMGIAVAAGTRHEAAGEEGLAHFCEHLSFKGTHRRTAVQIINSLEGVGGELNAFTNKEDTVYYCAIHRHHLRRAVDVLADIVFCSEYPQQEIEKECEVVCDEIESYEDSPAELIYDEIENLLFEGHPLGHNILGTSERVRSFTTADAKRFTHRYYQPSNCVLFASGDIDFGQLCRLAERATSGIPSAPSASVAPIEPLPLSETDSLAEPIVRHRSTHQAHVMLGARSYSADDPQRWALFLLNNIVGGPGLNSRLSLSLRERRALVYSVDSTAVTYSDTGLWCTYFGCDGADVKRCLRLVRTELDRLIDRPLSERQLRAAKQQLEGQLAIAADNREQFAIDFAKNYLHHGVERNLNDIIAHIEALTPSALQQVAADIFLPQHITTLVYL